MEAPDLMRDHYYHEDEMLLSLPCSSSQGGYQPFPLMMLLLLRSSLHWVPPLGSAGEAKNEAEPEFLSIRLKPVNLLISFVG